jgi:hypothetical protein
MDDVVERNLVEKGYVGETYVVAKLIRDFNIVSVKVPQKFFSYDLITSNNKRLEVKTAILRDFPRTHPSRTYHSLGWEFQRNPPQLQENASDYVVCICFKSENFSKEEPRCFIIPSSELRKHSNVFKILAHPTRGKRKFWNYENRWDLIVKDSPEDKT